MSDTNTQTKAKNYLKSKQLYDCAERSTNHTDLLWTTKIKAEKQRGDRTTDVM